MAGQQDLVSATTWVQWLLGGVDEADLLRGILEETTVRETCFRDGAFVNLETSQRWPAGSFEVCRVDELGRRVAEMSDATASHPDVRLSVIDGCDIGVFQARLRTRDQAMVQIASNFNCLEVPSRTCAPDYGGLVTGYATDATQGPAASLGVPAASLLRAHYAFYDPGSCPSTWGQSSARQVELLKHVQPHFGTCVNGKVTLDGNETPVTARNLDEVAQQIQVGLHMDAQVVFRRGGHGKLEVNEPFPLVDQLLTASVNWYSPGVKPQQKELENLTRAALRAAYTGTYQAALLRGRRRLFLTLVGGGSFSNPEEMILEELAAAHAKWAAHPASQLREVTLCLYPRNEAKRVQRDLDKLLAAAAKTKRKNAHM
jgi:hypothetical protein